MRRHAKASSAGSIEGQSGTAAISLRPRLLLASLGLLATLVIGVAVANAVAPAVSIENATGVAYTTATVKGEVDPQSQSTTYRFQYITEAKYQENLANTLPGFDGAANGPEGNVDGPAETVQGELTGLQPDTTYRLRLFAENGDGSSSAEAAAFTTEEVAAPSVTTPIVSAITSSGAHFAGEVNPNAPEAAPVADAKVEAAFKTTWTLTCIAAGALSSFGCEPGGGEISADNAAHPVSADATGLQPNKEYTVRLRASNAGGEVIATETFTTDAVAPDQISTSANTPESPTKTTIRGFVNPHNAPLTDCHFAYGLTDAYGSTAPCDSLPALVNEAVEVTAHLSGLTPSTTYHFQLLATNGSGEATSEDGTFSTLDPATTQGCSNGNALGADQLSECRAWEIVSPADNGGGEVSISGSRTRSAADGDAVTFMTLEASRESTGATAVGNEYLAKRTPGGWSTHSITPSTRPYPFPSGELFGVGRMYQGDLSPDLSTGVFLSSSPLSEQDPSVAGVTNLYLRRDLRSPGVGTYSLISACPACASPLPAEELESEPGMHYAGASADFSHVIFESNDNLTGQTTGAYSKLYEWVESTDTVRLVGILPDSACGTPPCVSEEASLAGNGAGGGGGLDLGTGKLDPEDAHYKLEMNAISVDGSRIFFSAPPFERGGGEFLPKGELYVRENGTATHQINVSERAVPDSHQLATFQGATADGSKVFFTSSERLTEGEGGTNLYMYDLDAPVGNRLTLISDAPSSDGDANPHVMYMAGMSQDGSNVYYVQAAANEVPELFVWNEGSNRYLIDHEDDGFGGLQWQVAIRSLGINTNNQFRVTPDGKYAVFADRLPATAARFGYDNLPDSPGARCEEHEEGCHQVYVYDFDANSLRCVSCAPSGARPTGDARLAFLRNGGPTRSPNHHNRAVTDDGSSVFFSSPDSLVAADSNGKYDAYRYDLASGKLSLLSSGQDGGDSYFVEADPDGSAAFFTTREQLSRWDIDDGYDLYVARRNGGLPEPQPAPPTCVGDACQPAAVPLNDPTPASSSFMGAGNEKQARQIRCRKGSRRVRRQGQSRCIASHRKPAKRSGRAGK